MQNEIVTIEAKINPIIAQANALVIRCQADLESAKDTISKVIKALKKEIDETFDIIISKAFSAHKEAVAQKKRHYEPLDAAERQIKQKMGTYLDEQDRIRRILEQQQRDKDEKIRQAQIEVADQRIATLMGRSDDISMQIADLEEELDNPELRDLDRERIGAQIQALQRKYNSLQDKVEEKQIEVETVLTTPAPAAVIEAPKVAGLSSRTELIPEVVNPLALVKAIADGRFPPGLIKEWDYALLKKLVNSGMNIPGVSSQSRRVMGVR
ncbi:MAG: hypothetical protein ABIJ57_03415 [Pseudomonadota bacterium]